MTELQIADQNMYGYRNTGPNDPRTRVRVFAGQPIPPDLVDLEPAGDELTASAVEGTHVALSAEEQEQVQAERDEAAKAAPSAPSGPVSRSPSQHREAGRQEAAGGKQSQQRGGAKSRPNEDTD